MTSILIVDDDPVDLRQTAEMAARTGLSVLTATGGEEALAILRATPGIAVVVLDLVMPDLDGLALLGILAREQHGVPVIAATAAQGIEAVGSAMRQGAVDFIVKPVSAERLGVAVVNAMRLARLQHGLARETRLRAGMFAPSDLLAHSPAMERVAGLVRKAARSTQPVLVEGERGTGKHLLAEAIRGGSERAGRPLIRLDCAAHAPDALDIALYGRRRSGVLEPGAVHAAQGGTLVLAEIGALDADGQARLLDLVRDGIVRPAGATGPERVNLRLVATSRMRLLNLARSGALREDLYYRLNVLPIYLPPLRERPDDIVPLARHALDRFAAEAGTTPAVLSPEALDLLRAHDWPGNLAELQTTLLRALTSAADGEIVPADLPHLLARRAGLEALATAPLKAPDAPLHIDAAVLRRQPAGTVSPDRFLAPDGEVASLADIERQLIVFALEHHGNRMSRVARALGIGRSTLYRKLREYGLDADEASDAA